MTVRRAGFVILALICWATAEIIVHWQGFAFGLGLTNASGRPYLAWSGFLSIVVPVFLQLVGIGLLLWWHHTCHELNCLRYGRRITVDQETGEHVRRCVKHHESHHGR